MLAWKAIAGATGYILEFGWNGKDFYPLVNLPPSQIQYEDFTALPGSTESYRLQAVTSSGSGDWLRADATTPAASANPVPVTPAYDIQKAATASIGPAGGTVSLTDAGGVQYKLDIPAGALAQATQIQLIPLTGLEGWPLDGARLAAVRIDPTGVQLTEVGKLTITLKSPGKADLATVGFASQITGGDFHLERISANTGKVAGLISPGGRLAAPSRQDANVLTLQVVKLAILGAGQGSAAAISDLGRNNAPADSGAAVAQQQAVMDAEGFELSRLEPVTDTGAKNAARELEGEMGKIEDQIREADDGDGLDAAMQQFQKWQEGTQPLTSDEYRQMTEGFWQDLTAKFKEMLDRAATDCRKQNGPPPQGVGSLQQMLESAMNPPSVNSQWAVLQDKMTGAYGKDVLTKAWSNLKNGVCGPYKTIGNAGYIGKICSLARPFTLNNSFGGLMVITFIPVTTSRGLVYVTQHIKAMNAFTDTFGSYDVDFQANGEAFIHHEYAGMLYIPGEPGVPFKTTKDQVDIKRTEDPSCP